MNRFKVYIGIGICLIPIFLFSQINEGGGKLFRWDLYKNYSGSDSTAFQRTLYDYPLPELRVETNYQFEEGLWIEQTRINYTYDALGRIIENIFERYDQGTREFIPQTRTQTFPRGGSPLEIDSVFTYNWSANQNGWDRFIAQRNRFNAQNQLIESETVISFSGQEFINQDKRFYDVQNNLVRIENYTLVNGRFMLTSFSNNVYEQGLLKKVTAYAAIPPNDSVPLNLSITSYNENQLASSIEGFNWDIVNKGWVKSSLSLLSYTATSQIQSKITELVSNGVSQVTRSDYFYQDNDQLVQEKIYTGTGEPPEWTLDSKKFYFYDVASSIKEPNVRAVKISPNPSRDEIQLNLPSGISFQVFNTAGQIQVSGKINGQNRLDIRQWPNGLYWIVAQEGQMRWVGKVLKE